MTTSTRTPPTLGRCPECRTEIASFDVSIAEPATGPPSLFAECPTCRIPVNPE